MADGEDAHAVFCIVSVHFLFYVKHCLEGTRVPSRRHDNKSEKRKERRRNQKKKKTVKHALDIRKQRQKAAMDPNPGEEGMANEDMEEEVRVEDECEEALEREEAEKNALMQRPKNQAGKDGEAREGTTPR